MFNRERGRFCPLECCHLFVVCCITYLMLNSYFSLSLYFTENGVDIQIFREFNRIPHGERVVSLTRALTEGFIHISFYNKIAKWYNPLGFSNQFLHIVYLVSYKYGAYYSGSKFGKLNNGLKLRTIFRHANSWRTTPLLPLLATNVNGSL